MKRVKVVTARDTPEDTQMVTHQDNPLLIDVVVEHLFKIIPFNCNEYKNLRQVSKLFWKTSLPTWRRNMWISVNGRIYRSNNSCPYIECYLDMLGAAYSDLLLGKFGFQKYKLEDWEFKFGAGGRINRKKLEFWSKVGDKMTHLKSSNSVFHTREDFQRVIFEFMPNLQFLSLERNVYKCGQPSPPAKPVFYKGFAIWEDDLMLSPDDIRGNVSHVEISLWLTFNCKLRSQEEFPVWWSHFFARFPNIKVLKLQNLNPSLPHCSNLELQRLLGRVEMLRAKCGPHILAQLEELDILSVSLRATKRLSHRSISHLRNFAFPLKSLAIEMGFKDPMVDDIFRIILETHCNTLQKLTVYRGAAKREDMPSIEFPAGVHLPHLIELKLIGNVFDSHLFLKATPNLRTLIVMDENGKETHSGALGLLKNEDGFSLRYLDRKEVCSYFSRTPLNDIGDAELAEDRVVCSKLEVFITAAAGYILDGNRIAGIAKVMPNLKKLGIVVAHGDFAAVCEKFKDLEALHIDIFFVTEKDVLGIENGMKYRFPNITNLTRLKYFGTGLDRCNEALSNDSILHGLLALPNLEDVALKLARDVTMDVILMLESKFPHIKSQPCNDDKKRCALMLTTKMVVTTGGMRIPDDDEDSQDSSSECDADTD